MNTYIEYVLYGRDDSPLYLFESSLEEHPEAKAMQDDYVKPKYFNFNLFELLEEEEMPPHRWFLIGPKRSGSEIHQDPLGTSAWNTSVQGFKRWILIPPSHQITKKFVRAKHLMKKGEDDEAIHYFDFIYPRLKSLEHHSEGKLPEIIDCIQYPGETMFVPGAWWHAVINLDATIAITENVCNAGNFERVWIQTRRGRKRLAYKWLKQLRKHYPQLFQKALELNYRDGFQMWTPRVSSKKKAHLTEHPYDGEGESSSEVSSSTSSSSSVDSSDDEATIGGVRDGCFTPPEIMELLQSPKPFKYILMVRGVNRIIRSKLKAQNGDSKGDSKDRAGTRKPELLQSKSSNGRRSRSTSPPEQQSDVQYSGGALSEVESLRKTKQF
jgi:histone arginine demethylase JMJD6